MDYCYEATYQLNIFNREFNQILLERMEMEADYIINCLEANYIIEEADTTNETKTKSLWEKIKDFFAKLLGIFSNKAKSLVESDKTWMDDNFNKLNKIDYTNIAIEILPFLDLDRMREVNNKFQQEVESAANNKAIAKKYKKFEDFKNDKFGNYVNENGDLATGLKNLYRTGNPKGPLKYIQKEGNDLKTNIPIMKNYCYNYYKNTVSFVKGLMKSCEDELQRIEDSLTTKSVEDNFCMIENNYFRNTDLIYCENYLAVFEVVNNQQQNQNNQQQSQNNQQQEAKPTNVNIIDKSNKQEDQNNQAKQEYSNMESDHLLFIKNIMLLYQTNITAMMTVLEEKYNAYKNLLKGLVDKYGNRLLQHLLQRVVGEADRADPHRRAVAVAVVRLGVAGPASRS
jgi:hypothetical protein